MKIYYGIVDQFIDVTDICFSKLLKDDIIFIPYNDNLRAFYFTDPLIGIQKQIFIDINGVLTNYNDLTQIQINVSDYTIKTIGEEDVINRLSNIHANLKIKYGFLTDEYPEQKMVARYLTGNEKVLELGGNIGRNSLVISSIVGKNNLVTLESDTFIANQLRENRDLNNLHFYVENSALSMKKLIQRGWETIQSDILIDNFNWINIISFKELTNKYNINFDTLVIDCEGAFYYILMDMPEILNNIKLIIMENDYHDINQKKFINNKLIEHNFYRDYLEGGGWGPCSDYFYEVWKK
jgi:FkbM family methyltransferase